MKLDVESEAETPGQFVTFSKVREAQLRNWILRRSSKLGNQKEDKNCKMGTSKIKNLRMNNNVRQFISKLKKQIVLSDPLNVEQHLLGENQDNINQTQQLLQKRHDYNLVNGCFVVFKCFINIIVFLMASIISTFNVENSMKTAFTVLQSIFVVCLLLENAILIGSMWGESVTKTLRIWICNEARVWEIALILSILLYLHGIEELIYVTTILLLRSTMNLSELFSVVYNDLNFEADIDRYWKLIKIIFFNFFIAHIISIILNMVPESNEQNWYSIKDIADSHWLEQYLWGCYWSINIMLTVGFGDLCATNVKQAALLIFIETFACAIFAYNISEVSKILQNKEEINEKKTYKSKIFHKIAKRYELQHWFVDKIKNFIFGEIDQEQTYSFIEEQKLIAQLPKNVQSEVLRKINQSIFCKLSFFGNFSKKVQLGLAQKIHKTIAHPQQTIMRRGQPNKIIILRVGVIDMMYKRGFSKQNGTCIQTFQVQQKEPPKLLSLKFLWNECTQTDLKARSYSIINYLNKLEFETLLKEICFDTFEFYCQERDSTSRNYLNKGVRACHLCKSYWHSKIDCPKFHYIPSKEHLIQKHLFKGYNTTVERTKIIRSKNKLSSSCCLKKFYSNDDTISQMHASFSKYQNCHARARIQTEIPQKSNNKDQQLILKIEKCQLTINEAVTLLKNENMTGALEFDLAYNFKRYFPKSNSNSIFQKGHQCFSLPF